MAATVEVVESSSRLLGVPLAEEGGMTDLDNFLGRFSKIIILDNKYASRGLFKETEQRWGRYGVELCYIDAFDVFRDIQDGRLERYRDTVFVVPYSVFGVVCEDLAVLLDNFGVGVPVVVSRT